MDTVDRIFSLLDETDMEQQAFAAAVGVSDDTASNWRRRKSASYSKYLAQIAEVLNTTTEYLLTGNGPQYKCDVVLLPTGGPDQPDLMVKYNQLTPEGQKETLAFIEFKLQQQKNKGDSHETDSIDQ